MTYASLLATYEELTYCLGCKASALTDFLWLVRVALVFPAIRSHSLMVESWLPGTEKGRVVFRRSRRSKTSWNEQNAVVLLDKFKRYLLFSPYGTWPRRKGQNSDFSSRQLIIEQNNIISHWWYFAVSQLANIWTQLGKAVVTYPYLWWSEVRRPGIWLWPLCWCVRTGCARWLCSWYPTPIDVEISYWPPNTLQNVPLK